MIDMLEFLTGIYHNYVGCKVAFFVVNLFCFFFLFFSSLFHCYMSLGMRKPAFCICKNKEADHLCGNREADQRLCFPYIASTIPLLPKSKISSL